MDCFVASAPRNDDLMACLRDLAARRAGVLLEYSAPMESFRKFPFSGDVERRSFLILSPSK
jgi:CRISPR-associated Cas5-like protein